MNQALRNKNQAAEPARASLGQTRSTGQLRPVGRTRPASHGRSAPVFSAGCGHSSFRIPVRTRDDVLEARRRARELASALQFSPIDRTLIASAVSELGRNIVDHAERGEICIRGGEGLGPDGIVITATDRGPGIRDLRSALQEGMGPARTLGLGLPGVRRIMDEFDIVSKPRQGTTVTVKKWKPQ